jgi:hypothetical protein
VRVDVHQTLGGDISLLNHFFLDYTGAASGADLVTLGNNIKTNWNAQFLAQQTNQLTLTEFVLTDISSVSSPRAVIPDGSSGLSAGAFLPAGTAAVLKFIGARRSRGGHYKMYLAGFLQADLLGPQSWTAAFITAIAADWAAITAGWVGLALPTMGAVAQVGVSYFHGNAASIGANGRAHNKPVLRAVPIVDPINSFTLNPKPASQRRRNLQGT